MTKTINTYLTGLCSFVQVLPPAVYMRVTDNIPQIVAFIERIIRNGHAYVTNQGTSLSLFFFYWQYVKSFPSTCKEKMKLNIQYDLLTQGMSTSTLSPLVAVMASLWILEALLGSKVCLWHLFFFLSSSIKVNVGSILNL